MANNDRDYLVGSTIRLKVATRDPETRAPLDPPTPPVLDTLVLFPNTVVPLPDEVDFTRLSPGEWRLSLQTGTLVPGVYTWRAKATDELGDVALSEDTFIVSPAT